MLSNKGLARLQDKEITGVHRDLTVLCIPGPWATRADFQAAVFEAGTGHVFAGGVLMDRQSHAAFRISFEEADPRLVTAFHNAGSHWRDTPDMVAIASHRSVVRIVDEGCSRGRAEALMQAAAALVKAGGLGVKVDSSGLAHTPAQWLELTASAHLGTAFHAMVVSVRDSEAHTCGMHNFGMADVQVGAGDPQAVLLALQFAHYLFFEGPAIEPGQTFSVSLDAPAYHIEEAEPVAYAAGSPLANPFGTWRLVPLETAH